MTKTKKYLLVDPPSGWMYGFPAPLEKDYVQQLLNAGYPKKDIPLALKHSRYMPMSKDIDESIFDELVEEAEANQQWSRIDQENRNPDPIELIEVKDPWKDIKL